MSSCKTENGGEKERNGTEDRVLENSHSCGGREQKGSRKKWSFQRGGSGSPIFSLFSSATPSLLKRCVEVGAPAQPRNAPR